MTDIALTNFRRQIEEWLAGLPAYSEIEQYARHVPESDTALIEWAAALNMGDLIELKNREFGSLWPGLTDRLTELEQINDIRLFTQYAANSVIANLRKQYPDLTEPKPEFESWVGEWSLTYELQWDAAALLASAFDYIRQLVYVKTLQDMKPPFAQISEWRTKLEQIFVEDGKSFEKGGSLSHYDRSKLSDTLKSLKFLPDETIEQLLTPKGDEDRFFLLNDLLNVFSLAEAVGETRVYDGSGVLNLIMWKQLQGKIQEKILVEAETNRLDSSEEAVALDNFCAWLNETWSLDAVKGGTMPTAIADYIDGLESAGDIKEFTDLFIGFLHNSDVVDMILDSVEPMSFIAQIQNSSNYTEARELASSLADQVEESALKPLARNLAVMTYQVLERLKTRNQHVQ